MRKHLFTICLVIMPFTSVFARSNYTPDSSEFVTAAKFLNRANSDYNPSAAFTILNRLALGGDKRAMSGVGAMYAKGLGVLVDSVQALFWLKKSASLRYEGAWLNLISMYRYGFAVNLNYREAYRYAFFGSKRGITTASYLKGYLLFKGFGCRQDYQQAIPCLKASVAKGYGPAMYLLGICYRNGYGINKQEDSARYWLSRAANRHSVEAKEELSVNVSETYEPPAEAAPRVALLLAPFISTKTIMRKVSLGTRRLRARYDSDSTSQRLSLSGYGITKDWSRSHILNKKRLTLELNFTDSTFTGSWQLGTGPLIDVSGHLKDSLLIFDSGEWETKEHNTQKTSHFKLRGALLHKFESGDSTFVWGRISLWAKELREPSNPFDVVLSQVNSKAAVAETNSILKVSKAYPNPFLADLTISYKLSNPSKGTIKLVDINSGVCVYSHDEGVLQAGSHELKVNVNVRSGIYILSLEIPGERYSTIVLKN